MWLQRYRCLICGTPFVPDHQMEDVCPLCWHQRVQKKETGPSCELCHQPLLTETKLCMDCQTQSWSFEELIGLGPYNSWVGFWTAQYKMRPVPQLIRALLSLFAWEDLPPGVVVPVPSHHRRVWQRGWDPVEHLAQAISKRKHWPLRHCLRRHAGEKQKLLGREKRFQNARSSFFWSGCEIQEELVWLVDDVVTTGATVETCSALLKNHGAREVKVLCLSLH